MFAFSALFAILFDLTMSNCTRIRDSPFGKKELVAVILMESEGEDSKELREKKLVHTTKLKRFFTEGHQKYDMLKPGRQKNLPKKLIKEWKDLQIGQLSSHHLHAHLRIMGGTKILSFSDSDFLAREVERGNLRKGGGFKHAGSELNFEGLSLYVIDDYNRECEFSCHADLDLKLYVVGRLSQTFFIN